MLNALNELKTVTTRPIKPESPKATSRVPAKSKSAVGHHRLCAGASVYCTCAQLWFADDYLEPDELDEAYAMYFDPDFNG